MDHVIGLQGEARQGEARGKHSSRLASRHESRWSSKLVVL